MLLSFRGGIHIDDHKDLAKSRPIREINAKDTLIFPLRQHIGKPAVATVDVGDKVVVGQIIGQAQDGISASVVSSVSGEVASIEDRMTVGGSWEKCIIVSNDYKYTTTPDFGKDRDYSSLTKEEILQIIRDAGIVGLGGACFPTHVKLNPKNPADVDFILVNACECEPYLTSDYRLLLEESDMLITGLEIVLKLLPNAKGVICIENNKKDAYDLLQKKLAGKTFIDVKLLKTKYPQGSERQLIHAVTSRKLNSNLLPADVGVIVENIDTIISIAYAVCKHIPLIRRIMTIAGDALNDTANLKVRLGIQYTQLVDEVGGFKCKPELLISGGPMMGISMYDLNVPVSKNSSAFLAFAKDPVSKMKETNCLNCGRCIDACPINLMPTMLYRKVKNGDVDAFMKLNGMDCIECGCCSYVCPAKKPLTETFKAMKVKARNKVAAAKKGVLK